MVPKTVLNKRSRAVATAGFLFYESLTRAALALADPDIKTEAQAAALFEDAAKGRRHWKAEGALELGSPTFDTTDWSEAQRWLWSCLPRIARAHDLAES